MPAVQFHTSKNTDQIVWPETEDGSYARRYLLPFLADGPQAYIRNVHNTELMVAQVGETLIPLTVTDFHADNSYICSPYSHYISYGGYEEVQRLDNPPAEALIRAALHPVAWYFRRARLDRVVYVNNWLLSTNLYPQLDEATIHALSQVLPEMFPDRTVIFRSVDERRNPLLLQTLRGRGYRMVLSRQVWYMQPEEARRTRQVKEDVRALRHHPYAVVDGKTLTDDELSRCLELYNQLYLEKYSYYNPQFTTAFLRLARDADILQLRALRRDGQINGVMGFFVRNGLMTQPLFGYDTRLPVEEGLYRLLTLITLQEGQERNLLVHASGGVGKFKKIRGGKSVIEYNAVYDRHLPIQRRLPWRILQRISAAAIPIFQRNDF
ncbi:MAG: GNAT family N-acetyltransferase [Chloroflexi bacterium]|nr:MAG: GNAT family N-acetyltransferase [Chloroflexota bacterium]